MYYTMMENIIQNDMAEGLTFQQLQKMGGSQKPLFNAAPTSQSGYTFKQLQQMNQGGGAGGPDQTTEKKSVGGFFSNALSSGAKFAGGIASAFEHPVQTAETVAKLGVGVLGAGIEKMIPEKDRQISPEAAASPTGQLFQQSKSLFGKVAEDYKQSYGSPQKAADTAYKDPFRVAGDVAAVVTAGGSALSTAGEVSGISKVAEAGNVLTKVGEAANPVNAAFKVAGGALGITGKVAAGIAGKSTGAGAFSVEEAFSNPNVMKYARKAGPDGALDLQDQALTDSLAGLKTLKTERGQTYVADLEKIKVNKTDMQNGLEEIRSKASKDLVDPQKLGVKITGGKKLNNLDFSKSTITKNTAVVEKAFNDVMDWRDTTPAGLDMLKKRISQHIDEIPATEAGGARAYLVGLRENVSGLLKKQVPGYQDMVGKYEQASNLIDDIQSSLSLKDTVKKETAIRKIQGALRENNDMRREFIQTLGKEAGVDITGKLAAGQLAPYTARGLAGTIQSQLSTAAGVGAVLKPQFIPQIIIALAATSPRLVGELSSILGKTARAVKAITPQQSQQIILLLQKANEMSTDDPQANAGDR